MTDIGLALNPEVWPVFDPLGDPHKIPTPGIFDEPVVNVCINSTWIGHISGMVERLAWEDAWQGTDAEKFAAVQQIYQLFAEWGKPENIGVCTVGCCCTPTLSRITASGVYQTSTNGTDWVDSPISDPRNQATALPPQTGTDANDVRCKSANSMVSILQTAKQQYSDQLATATSLTELVAAVVAILALIGIIGTGGALAPLCLAIAAAVIGLTQAEFDADFTDPEWTQLTLRIYCDLDENGKIKPGKFTDILAGIVSIFGSTGGGRWLFNLVNAFGTGGMESAGAIPSGNAVDCSAADCATCPYDVDYTVNCPSTGMLIVEGACSSGNGININHFHEPGYYNAIFIIGFNEPCGAKYWHLTTNFGTGHANTENWIDRSVELDEVGDFVWIDGHDAQFACPNGINTAGGIFVPDLDPRPALAIRVHVNDGGYLVGDDYITRLKLDDTAPP